MRKFLPRLFNIISFSLCIALIMPWNSIAYLVGFFSHDLQVVIESYEFLKIAFIPAILIVISFIFFIVSMIDRGIKKHNGYTTEPIINATMAPIYYMGLAFAACGIISSFVGVPLKIYDGSWFGLGQVVNGLVALPEFNKFVAMGIYFALFLIIGVIALFGTKKLYKKGFFARFFVILVLYIFVFISYQGLQSQFKNPETVNVIQTMKDTFTLFFVNSPELKNEAIGRASQVVTNSFFSSNFYIILAICGLSTIIYVICGIFRIIFNNNKISNRVNELESADDFKNNNAEKNYVQQQAAASTNSIENDPLFVLPTSEEIIETQIEEKTVIKQVTYENSDLDQIFDYEFGFKYCSMVKKDNKNDYYVNKQNFLSITNHNTTLVFRLDLDTAIKTILKYPFISKDRYENHKIWFKIEDVSILNKDTVVDIIKKAYNTVLNNQ